MKIDAKASFCRRVQMSPSLPNYRLSSMDELEHSLSLLQNKTRRSILERLVREPHYPMQLADLIGVSQQAIVKHLKELERGHLVEKTQPFGGFKGEGSSPFKIILFLFFSINGSGTGAASSKAFV